MDFINREHVKYEGVKIVKDKDLGVQGYIRLPKWLLGRMVVIRDPVTSFSSSKLVVSSLGGACLLFGGEFIGRRFSVSYRKEE